MRNAASHGKRLFEPTEGLSFHKEACPDSRTREHILHFEPKGYALTEMRAQGSARE